MLSKIYKHIKQGTILKVVWSKYHPNKYIIRVLKLPHVYNRLEYKRKFGLFKSINHPETFDQKIFFLRDNYDQNPLATQVSDKLKVRDYIESLGLEHLLNELIGVYDSANEIDFENLPNQFMIKTNHASGTNIIVKDKSEVDIKDIKKQLDKWLKKNYAYSFGEMQYLNIEPKIIIEKYLEDKNSDNEFLIDYKFWCFNGEPKFLHVNKVGEKQCCFDLNFKRCHMFNHYDSNCIKYLKPHNFSEMIAYASKIAAKFDFARVDFYLVNDIILFSEITLTPNGGNNHFLKIETQDYLGTMLDIRF